MRGKDEDTSGELALDRLVFSSDAVFAITLLVRDMVPLLSQWGMFTALVWTRIEKRFYSRRAVRAEAVA